MMKKMTMTAGALLVTALMAAPAFADGSGSVTIDAIVKRGELNCGVAADNAMFSLPDSKGVMRGMDADSCRAVAAAILGDGNKIKFIPTTSQNRFTALQSGEVDLLYRSTTWTLGREGNLGGMFASVNYYDGTGFLVKTSSGVKTAKEMDGATICVAPGTSTELAIADYFRVNNMKFTPILIQDVNEIQNAFLSGRCDAYSTDSSSLAAFRFQQGDKAKDLLLLPDIISKEPLGGMVRKGDDKFFDIVRWTFFAQLIAEEHGITQANVDEALKSDVPEVRRLMGLEGDMGKALGVDNKFAYNAIKAVGNYGEMWARDVTPFGVPRGINNLWTKGGLQYAPPMR
jgi:general L-amino acid transport system substrate-binding protein